MKKFDRCTLACLIAASALLAGCASEQASPQTAEARNPCTGVAPPTGSMMRRNEDCANLTPEQRALIERNNQEMTDTIRASPGIGSSPVSSPGKVYR